MTIRVLGSIFYTGLSDDNPPYTTDLLSTPIALDTTATGVQDSQVVQILMRSTEEFYVTTASNSSEATTRLSSNTTRALLPAGVWTFDISGSSNLIYIKSADGSDHSDGVSIIFSERD